MLYIVQYFIQYNNHVLSYPEFLQNQHVYDMITDF